MEEVAEKGIDTFFDQLNVAIDLISTKLIEATPKAADLIIQVTWFEGVFSIVSGIVCVVLAFLVARFVLKKVSDDPSLDSGLTFFICIFGGAFSSLLAVGSLIDLFNLYNWLAVFSPEAAIAYKIMQQVTI